MKKYIKLIAPDGQEYMISNIIFSDGFRLSEDKFGITVENLNYNGGIDYEYAKNIYDLTQYEWQTKLPSYKWDNGFIYSVYNGSETTTPWIEIPINTVIPISKGWMNNDMSDVIIVDDYGTVIDWYYDDTNYYGDFNIYINPTQTINTLNRYYVCFGNGDLTKVIRKSTDDSIIRTPYSSVNMDSTIIRIYSESSEVALSWYYNSGYLYIDTTSVENGNAIFIENNVDYGRYADQTMNISVYGEASNVQKLTPEPTEVTEGITLSLIKPIIDSNWNKYWCFEVTNNSLSQTIDGVIKIDFDSTDLVSNAYMRQDGRDFRIVTLDDDYNIKSFLPYYIDKSTIGTTNTEAYFTGNILPNETKSYAIMFDNQYAQDESNPNEIFDFFDGFDLNYIYPNMSVTKIEDDLFQLTFGNTSEQAVMIPVKISSLPIYSYDESIKMYDNLSTESETRPYWIEYDGSDYWAWIKTNGSETVTVEATGSYSPDDSTFFPTTNLVSYYGLDETSGTTIYDYWGDNDGTITDSSIMGATGNENYCIDFTQGNDYIIISNFEGMPAPNTAQSYMFWIKPTYSATAVEHEFFSYGEATDSDGKRGLRFRDMGLNDFDMYYAYYNGDGGIGVDIFTQPDWTCIVVTKDASGNLIYYKNGVQYSTGSISQPEDVTLKTLILGADIYQSRYFDGYLDDVAIWNDVLTPNEVTRTSNFFQNQHNVEISRDGNTYEIGECSVSDYQVKLNVTDIVSSTTDSLKIYTGMSGAKSECIQNDNIIINTSLVSSDTVNISIDSSNLDYTPLYYEIDFGDGSIATYAPSSINHTYEDTSTIKNITVKAYKTQHVHNYNTTEFGFVIPLPYYISDSTNIFTKVDLDEGINTFYVCKSDGYISDETTVFNKIINNVKAAWDFSDGTTATDKSNNGYDGTLTNCSFIDGKYNKALSLSGNGYIDIGTFGTTDNMTFLTMYKTASTGRMPILGAPTDILRFDLNYLPGATGGTAGYIGCARPYGTNDVYSNVGATLYDNNWHTCTWKITDGINGLYFDGTELQTSSTVSNQIGTGDISLKIGIDSNTYYYDGLIEYVAIIDDAISDVDITDINNSEPYFYDGKIGLCTYAENKPTVIKDVLENGIIKYTVISSQSLTDYQLPLNTDGIGDLSDNESLLISKENHTYEIKYDYWLENTTNMWTRLDLKQGDNVIYVTRESGNEQDPDNIFDMYDGFNGSLRYDYDYSALASVSTENNYLTTIPNEDTWADNLTSGMFINVDYTDGIEVNIDLDYTGQTSDLAQLYLKISDSADKYVLGGIMDSYAASDPQFYYKSSTGSLLSGVDTRPFSDTTNIKIRYIDGVASVYEKDELYYSQAISLVDINKIWILHNRYLTFNTKIAHWDNLFVRKIINNEPVSSKEIVNANIIKYTINCDRDIDNYAIKLNVSDFNIQDTSESFKVYKPITDDILLPYWLESTTNGYTKVNLTTGDNVFYISTTGGYVSDPENVFQLFDDFSGDALNTDKWQSNNISLYTISDGILTLNDAALTYTDCLNSTKSYSNCIIETKFKANGSSVSELYFEISDTLASRPYKDCTAIRIGDSLVAGINASYSTGGTGVADTWYKSKLIIPTEDTAVANISDINDNIIAEKTGTPYTRSGYIMLHKRGYTGNVDIIFVRKYISSEPTLSYELINDNLLKVTVNSTEDIEDYQLNFDCTQLGLSDTSTNLKVYCNYIDELDLPYWTETINKTWTKTDLKAGMNVLYVSNDGTEMPNGDDVFEFFDDFSGTELDTDKWLLSRVLGSGTYSATVSNNMVDLYSEAGGTAAELIAQKPMTLPVRIIGRRYCDGIDGEVGYTTPETGNYEYRLVMQDEDTDLRYVKRTTSATIYETISQTPADTFSFFENTVTEDTYKWYEFGSQLNTVETQDLITTETIYPMFHCTGGTHLYCNLFAICKYMENKPIITKEIINENTVRYIIECDEDISDYQIQLDITDLGISDTSNNLRVYKYI